MSETSPPILHEAPAPDRAAAAALVEGPLAEAAGPGAWPVSLTLDYGAPLTPGEAVRIEAAVDRATRTLVFANARVLRAGDGTLLATASAVFGRRAE